MAILRFASLAVQAGGQCGTREPRVGCGQGDSETAEWVGIKGANDDLDVRELAWDTRLLTIEAPARPINGLPPDLPRTNAVPPLVHVRISLRNPRMKRPWYGDGTTMVWGWWLILL